MGEGRGHYKQLYYLNIAVGSITIPKKPGKITHTHTQKHNTKN